MKNTIKKAAIMISFIFLFLSNPVSVLAWDDCSKGKVNDPYPGDCARYVDTDGNGICDHSEPAPEDRVENVEKSVESPTGNMPNNNGDEVNIEKKEITFPKFLVVIAIVIFNLVAILIYRNYKNLRAKNL